MGSSEINYFPKKDGVEKSTPLSDGDILRKLCPDYLAMGMTLDEFWNGDADLPVYYRKAHHLKRKQANQDAWLQGFYVYQALQCASPLFRDLVKDHNPEPYPEKPLDLYPEKVTNKEEEQKRAEMNDLEIQAKVKDWAKRVNRLKSEKKEA